ncbi:MAG: hypothetical protein ACYCZW_02420 [Minisyncoccota bacterium]
MTLFKNKKLLIIIFGIGIIILLLSKNSKDDLVYNDTKVLEYESKPSPELLKNVPKLRGNRVLGIGISEGKIGFDKSFALAKSVGVNAIELPIFWDESEPEVKKYNEGWMPIADQFYSKSNIKINLALNPIDTNNLRLPKDLKDKPLNDPEVIERYKAFVDFAAKQFPNSDIFSVSVGNEVDVYLGSSDKKWQEYTEFFSTVAPYLRQKFPNAMIGSKITFDGAINMTNKVKHFNEFTDILLTTYYPFKKNSFVVRDPVTVHDDFKHIVVMYPNKKIFFAEIGYPSGYLNESSETKQADFIRETFAAWDTYYDNIPFLDFQWLHDQSPETVVGWQKYYGLKDEKFASFLSTLGLRTYDGKDKESFVVFGEEIKKRGW